ncbi:hypothetical protein [Sedimentimonas flavescens]|uniref:hypothetical protein n=1 Tax=Sedimentimonas flavescens TaxID=2851012 RepID=UPI001C49DE57|nr:hypothetical protein [Sedimentimonas flavescens]MBW0156659.1 hypothetical protein [Sedimentimonas flavescens]MCT2539153.1 hypothetical protein [Sedimentimonas flavescens]
MPELVRLYIRNVFAGLGLSVAFVGLLLWFNVANLWHLISSSDIGYIAVALLVVFNTVVFSGVQFAICIMRMGHDDGASGGGKRDAIPAVDASAQMVPVRVEAPVQRRKMPR